MATRYGGEEFAIILPETDLTGAMRIANAVRETINAMAMAHEGSPYHIVTVSIGVASARPSRGNDRNTLLEAADQALYRAKAAGRNAVRSLGEDHAPSRGSLPNAAA
ncbi:GGDEF domain-containing protein [Microvirga arabica]|uniref:GGDEF domain-containing protein n=1 Tax=Microvirga arabica TaxID=1128671 RepID=UPI0036060F76